MSEALKEDGGSLFDESVQAFEIRDWVTDKVVSIVAKKDEHNDYPALVFEVDDRGRRTKLTLGRDELAAITFCLARQDQQSKLLDARYREYKEVPVRLVAIASRDIKKGSPIVMWRKERVPIDFEYTHEPTNNMFYVNKT